MAFDISLPSLSFFSREESFAKRIADAIPVEGAAFLVASIAVRVFSTSLTVPFLGIGISIIASKFLLKAIDAFDHQIVIDLTKEVCKINRMYPNLQTIGFICAIAFSFTSQSLSFLIGVSLGGFGSIVLDVERYKLLQQWNRLQFG